MPLTDVFLGTISLFAGWLISAYQADEGRREEDARHRTELKLLEQMHSAARFQHAALHSILLQLEAESGGRVRLHRDADGNVTGARHVAPTAEPGPHEVAGAR